MIDEYCKILLDQFKFDVNVLSHWWMYAPLLIPAIAYMIFFFIKWTILTAPIWIPFRLAARGLHEFINFAWRGK